jgi:hypothetical protein
MIGRVSLKATYFYRLIEQSFFDTSAFAKNLNGTDASTASAYRIRIKDHTRRTMQIAARYLLDKRRHINAGWASLNARGVVAIETPIRFRHRLGLSHRRIDLSEILLDLRNIER